MKHYLQLLATFTLGIVLTISSISLFKNELLAWLDIELLPTAKVAELKASQQRLNSAQKAVQSNKLSIKKRQALRVAKRVTSVTAATIIPYADAVAVPVIVIGMEAHDYCEQQHEQQALLNIIIGEGKPFSFDDCVAEIEADIKRSTKLVSRSLTDSLNATLQEWSNKVSATSRKMYDPIFEYFDQ